jgi:hypothetical protein
VRRVSRGGIYANLEFTDCTHPAQNVLCDPERVKAWRIEEPQAPMRHDEPLERGWVDPFNWIGNLLGF